MPRCLAPSRQHWKGLGASWGCVNTEADRTSTLAFWWTSLTQRAVCNKSIQKAVWNIPSSHLLVQETHATAAAHLEHVLAVLVFLFLFLFFLLLLLVVVVVLMLLLLLLSSLLALLCLCLWLLLLLLNQETMEGLGLQQVLCKLNFCQRTHAISMICLCKTLMFQVCSAGTVSWHADKTRALLLQSFDHVWRRIKTFKPLTLLPCCVRLPQKAGRFSTCFVHLGAKDLCLVKNTWPSR